MGTTARCVNVFGSQSAENHEHSRKKNYLLNLDWHELGDTAGTPQRDDDFLSGQFAHDQRQVTFHGCLDGVSIDPLNVFCCASTTNHFHQKFRILHTLLNCGSSSEEKVVPVRTDTANAPKLPINNSLQYCCSTMTGARAFRE